MARPSLLDRLLPAPRHVVLGQPGVGWLGLLSSWTLLGFGATLGAASGSWLADLELACGTSERGCAAAAGGGIVAGVTSLGVAVLFGETIARGFGPPVRWWVAPIALAATGGAVAAGALLGHGVVALAPMLLGGAVLVTALILAVLLVGRGRSARLGWVRVDGLPMRDVGARPVETILAVAAVTAGVSGALLGGVVAELLARG